jgi:hypothetical protein
MAEQLTNSRRRFDKATYTPIRLAQEAAGGALAVAAAVQGASIAPGEIAQLRQQVGDGPQRRALEAIAALVEAPSADRAREASAALAEVDQQQVIEILERVRTLRTQALQAAKKALETPPPERPATGAPTRPAGVSLARLDRFRFRPPIEAAIADRVVLRTVPGNVSVLRGSGGSTMAGIVTGIEDIFDVIGFIKAVEPYVPPGTDEATLDPIAALEEIERRQRSGTVSIDALQRRTLEPIGLLHLELLQMTPEDIERGELVYSLPLAPKEKVTLSHKEWAIRETEFTEYVQDFLENFSEKGVAETDEIAVASERETRRTDRTSLSPTDGITITAPVDGGAAGMSVVTNTQSQRESRTHARSVTSRASSRSVRDHRVSFTVATTAGTEDFTARLLENASEDRAMRVDYYRRMRRWQVQLYRVGVRLTYDIVIPDPGRRLRARHELLRRYDTVLSAQFEPGVTPADLDGSSYLKYAAGYGAVLQEPPAAPVGSPTYQQWQMTSYAVLRDAAFARFTQVQEMIRQKRAEVARQIDAAADPLALRQLEREQIMRGVLEWLIPGFGTAVVNAGPGGLDQAAWLQVMEYGEYIKFVHSAIDWANLSYVLYPYFWAGGSMEQLFLRHADARHREFLRAGAARVFLPVEPGRENEWAALLDQGRFGTLPQGHRFAPILTQVRQAHETYAQAAVADNAAPGTLVGTWTEFTPTGALDIDVVTMPVNDL